MFASQSIFDGAFTRNDPFRMSLPERAPLVSMIVFTTMTTELEVANGSEEDASQKGTITLEALPDEMLVQIMKHLDDSSIGRMRRTSKRLAVMAQDESVWMSFFKERNWVIREERESTKQLLG